MSSPSLLSSVDHVGFFPTLLTNPFFSFSFLLGFSRVHELRSLCLGMILYSSHVPLLIYFVCGEVFLCFFCKNWFSKRNSVGFFLCKKKKRKQKKKKKPTNKPNKIFSSITVHNVLSVTLTKHLIFTYKSDPCLLTPTPYSTLCHPPIFRFFFCCFFVFAGEIASWWYFVLLEKQHSGQHRRKRRKAWPNSLSVLQQQLTASNS